MRVGDDGDDDEYADDDDDKRQWDDNVSHTTMGIDGKCDRF